MILRDADPGRPFDKLRDRMVYIMDRLVSLSNHRDRDQRTFGEKAVNRLVACQGPEFCLGKAFISPERQHYPLDADVFRREDFFFP